MKRYMEIRYLHGYVIVNFNVNGVLGYRLGKGVGETTRGAARAIRELLKGGVQ